MLFAALPGLFYAVDAGAASNATSSPPVEYYPRRDNSPLLAANQLTAQFLHWLDSGSSEGNGLWKQGFRLLGQGHRLPAWYRRIFLLTVNCSGYIICQIGQSSRHVFIDN